jgi:hypothetical protein
MVVRWVASALLSGLIVGFAFGFEQQMSGQTETLSGKHFRVSYPKSLQAYAKALLQIGDAAWEAYRELYNLTLPEPIELQIQLVPEKGEKFARLWTDGQRFIFLEVGSEKPLFSPEKGGAHNVYGICHELGHIAIYSRISQTAGIPEGVAEGWAHYFGSVITSHLFEKLGAEVYPDPHNYHETSGLGRLLRQFETRKDPETLAAKSLYEIERKYGRQKLGEALGKALSQRPSGRELVTKFVEALVAVTGDPEAKTLIPEQILKPKVRVDTEFPDIKQKWLYYGLKLEWQDGLLRLRYDDGEKDGQWSLGGSGHGVIFCKPQGKWQLVAVEFYGARYGELQPPDEDFSIFLCDADFKVIREFKAPYSLFAQRGEWKWERIAVEPTEVPEFFYIVIAFNPTATKGIYMAYDSDVPISHSRRAFPDSHLTDTEKVYDWMVRCYLKPADEETAKRSAEAARQLESELEALREQALAHVIRPDEEIVVEPYPDDPAEVVRQFMSALVKGDKKALTFVVRERRKWITLVLDAFHKILREGWALRFLHLKLARRNPEHDFFSRMAKRVVEVQKLGELCFAVWTGATSKDKPSVINVGTHAVALKRENGLWKVSGFETWWNSIDIPASAKPEEVERYLLEQVRATGITDYSAMGRTCYAPLPEDLAEAEKIVRQVLSWWQAGRDKDVLSAIHPKSKTAVGGDLKKFAETQKQARAKLKGMKLVRLVPHRDSIVQSEQPEELRFVEQTLTELFGAHPEKALGENWLYARVAIFNAEFSDGKRTVRFRLFAIKEGNRWLIANLPMP